MNNLFSSIQMTVVMVSRDMRIRRFTLAANQLFSFQATDVGRSITDMRLNLEIPQFARMLDEVIQQGVSKELEARTPEDYAYLLRMRPYRTEGNKVDGAVIVLIDIDALARTQETLRQRVEELAAADRHKNEFLAILAHELRNPLAPLRNAAHILKISPPHADVSAKARDLIERQVRHMSRMVNDLLDAARAQQGQIKLQKERLDLRDVITRASDMMQPQFEGKRQEFRLFIPDEALEIEGDATRLEQIVMNLLGNANKYTQVEGIIEVKLERDDLIKTAPRAVLRVRDNGQGIDAGLLPRLFELFTQADRSLAHSDGGLGIGLNLVRTLVELHGGTVHVQSDGENCGSEFTLRFPVWQPLEDSIDLELPATSGTPAPKTVTQRILVVDDNVDLAESSQALLECNGHEVRTAGTGQAALAVAADFRPTVIVLDLGLPDIDGYQVARQLRKMDEFASARLIAMSGYDTPEVRAEAKSAGFDHHLCKPVNFAHLESLLLS
jgi:two-component system CheB/CheR fusion protein